MKTINYLYLKKHNVTGLKYLGITRATKPYNYKGSGTRWLKHIKKHGNDVKTTILYSSDNKQLFADFSIETSYKLNVVEDTTYANLKHETGMGSKRKVSDISDYEINFSKNGMYWPAHSHEGRFIMKKLPAAYTEWVKTDAVNRSTYANTIMMKDTYGYEPYVKEVKGYGIPENPLDKILNKEKKVSLSYFLTRYLTPREERVIRMRYGIGDKDWVELWMIASLLNVSQERVGQIERKALRKLKYRLTNPKYTKYKISGRIEPLLNAA
jgi:hypothetical protein